MRTTAERRTAVLHRAATQLGLFTTGQALDQGMTRSALRAWARTGAVASTGGGVWAVTGVPSSDARRAMADVLGRRHRTVLALHSAAWVWDLPGHRLLPSEVLTVREERHGGRAGAHTSLCLDPCDVTVRRGLPVTTPTRTVFDLAGRQHPGRTAQDLDHLMGRGLVTIGTLREHLDRLAASGRPGIAVVRERIAAIEDGEEPTESGLERRCREILHDAGFTTLEQQVVLGDDEGFVARVDFLDRRRRIVVEVDSDRFHRGLLDRQLDAAKTARLEAAGWTVVRITEHEIFWERSALTLRMRRLRARTATPT